MDVPELRKGLPNGASDRGRDPAVRGSGGVAGSPQISRLRLGPKEHRYLCGPGGPRQSTLRAGSVPSPQAQSLRHRRGARAVPRSVSWAGHRLGPPITWWRVPTLGVACGRRRQSGACRPRVRQGGAVHGPACRHGACSAFRAMDGRVESVRGSVVDARFAEGRGPALREAPCISGPEPHGRNGRGVGSRATGQALVPQHDRTQFLP